MYHAKFLLNISSGSGEETDFIGLAISSYGGHLGFSTILNFKILKPCSMVMMHMKF